MRISDWSSDVCSSDLVDVHLVLGVQAGQHVEDLVVHGLDRLQHALAAIALLVAVAQLDRLVGAGRGAGGHGGAAEGAALQSDVDLDGRIDRKSTRLNSSPYCANRRPSPACKNKKKITRT